MSNLRLPFDEARSADRPIDTHDADARRRAVDPRFNVALEASAGTGKTRVLVDRYVNLLREGVDPANVLAITFTRKAAAEMRDRILSTLRAAAERGEIPAARWRELKNRTADIAICTIDAFCLSLLREFPLEADLDPGFSIADETEVPRLIDESLDRALRVCRAVSREDECVQLVFAHLGDRRARAGLAALLNRRIAAPAVLSRYLATGPRDLTVGSATQRAARGLLAVFDSMRGGLDGFIDSGPPETPFAVLSRRLMKLREWVDRDVPIEAAGLQATYAAVREHFLTQEGTPRQANPFKKSAFLCEADWQTQRALVVGHAPAIVDAYASYRRDLNVLVSRGVSRMYAIAETEYRKTLDSHAVLDFSDVLMKTLGLLRQMEEFSQSRYRLEARYHHVLVDEFQDTSRSQWELVSLLIQSWGEGSGLAHTGPLQPSAFIVGDRKQSIYGFRDADVSLLREATRYLQGLRSEGDVRRSISQSYRSVPSLLSFINDVCADIDKAPARSDAFLYEDNDQFPIESMDVVPDGPIGIIVGDTPEACAESIAGEIARMIVEGMQVRDRESGLRRPVRAGDVGILFRTRESHREYEAALERHGIRSYVYKGLGFFDSDEIKDVMSLIAYLGDPLSDLRAAAWMRSRFVRLSDEALRLLAPRLADALLVTELPAAFIRLQEDDANALLKARDAVQRWRNLVDRLPPAELLDLALDESAYTLELRGARFLQARENLKKMRALIRRTQNRGYTTISRIGAHLDRLAVGDESNAVIDAVDAVNLMTIHAAKGLEFPVVFVVNLARGTANRRRAIRVVGTPAGGASVSVGDFRSEADEDETARDLEETKRLLYVALTRARDRLYLSSVLKDGRTQPGRGSLAEVLPASLLDQLAEAATGVDIHWRANSGSVHRLRVPPKRDQIRISWRSSGVEMCELGVGADDFAPVTDCGSSRISVATAITSETATITPHDGPKSDRLVGVLVHRLLQRVGLNPEIEAMHLGDLIERLIRPDERVEVDDADELARRVGVAYRAIAAEDDIRELYSVGEPLHEVPFSVLVNGVIVRGSIDCLIQTGDQVTVLEFKTGRPHPAHDEQVELYRTAAKMIFPGHVVACRLVYASDPTVHDNRALH